jgi:uncharacterized protein YdhG (YjbR/CyaY superfamily)
LTSKGKGRCTSRPRTAGKFPTASVISEFRDDLKEFRTSKGTILFPIDEPLPIALIKKIVKARARQLESKKPR